MPIDKASNREVCYHLVQIQPGSTEYITVITAFSKTMVQRVNTQVLQIQRIQNPTLYHQYTSKRTDMNKQNQPGHQNERKLFHGTAADACDKINAQGLNRNFAGKNGMSSNVHSDIMNLFPSQQPHMVVVYTLLEMHFTLLKTYTRHQMQREINICTWLVCLQESTP